jgi:hypothetical protein
MVRTEFSGPLINLNVDFNKSEGDMRKWVGWCKDRGFGGFALIFSNPVDSPVLPDYWYDKLLASARVLVEEAKKLDLEVWIFDEWGYPSCVAAGLVCENKELRAKKLHVSYDRFLEPGETISIEIPDRTVSLKSIPVNRYGFYAPAGRCNDIAEENSTGDIVKYTSKGYERVILVTWEYVSFISHVPITNDPLNFSLGTPDLMNKEAASRFIKVVHEKFYDELKDYFGTVIKGFFYDEPEVCFDFPWTQGFENEFIKRKGYDLRDNLPILMAYAGNFYHPGYHEADLIIKNLVFDYFDVWTDLVAENFYGEIQKYCHKRGVLSVGHQDMDNHTKTLASVSGHFFKNSYYNDSPGIDVIGSNIDIDTFYDFPRFAGSCKRLYGKNSAMSETFAIMGIAHSPDRMRYLMEHQVIRGIDTFFNMISSIDYEEDTYDLFKPGNYINDLHGRNVNEHVKRAIGLANAGTPASDLAVYIPMRDIYAHLIRDNDAHNMNSILPYDEVDRIARILAYMPCDFDYIWDEAICELKIDEGFVTAKGQVIRTIIIPPGATIDDKVMVRLKRFVKSGGNVISILQRYANEFILCSDYFLLDEYVRPTVSLKSDNKQVSMCVRRDKDRLVYLFLNESARKCDCELSFRVTGDDVKVYSIDMNTGEMYVEDSTFSESNQVVKSVFEPGELKCYIVSNAKLDTKHKRKQKVVTDSIKCVTINLPNGTRYITDSRKLPSWADLGYPGQSGFVEYEIEFEWKGKRAFVDFGKVGHCLVCSLDKRVNPLQEGEKISFAPFKVDLGVVEEGRHILYVYVQNTVVNRYIGTKDMEKMFDIPQRIDSDRKMLMSGLFGEIQLFEEEDLVCQGQR